MFDQLSYNLITMTKFMVVMMTTTMPIMIKVIQTHAICTMLNGSKKIRIRPA